MKRAVFLLVLAAGAGCFKDRTSQPVDAEPRVTLFDGESVLDAQVVFSGDPERVRTYFAEEGIALELEPLDESARIYLARYGRADAVGDVLDGLRARVDFVEPNFLLNVEDVSDWPRDPEFINLWGLSNLGQNSPGGVEGSPRADIGVLEAWKITPGKRDIVVAVIDTGIDYLHPDLKDNIWTNEQELKGSLGVDDDGNGYIDDVYGWDFIAAQNATAHPGGQPGDNEPLDDNGHGTHCAGTIAAIKDNNLGVVGVAPNVRVMALKAFDDQGQSSGVDTFRAIRYGMEKKAQVLSNSWGTRANTRLIESAVKKANEQGVVFVAAAGNAGKNTDRSPVYPANYDVPNIISVGASDNNDRPAVFSNFGESSVDVFAPGVNILSTIPTTLARRPYGVASGTSMATPHVAGVVALLLSADGNLRGQPAAVKDRLIRSAEQSPGLIGKSVGGRVNAVRALKGEVVVPAADQLVIEPHAYRSPSFPTVQVDDRHTIKKPGARALKVHFDFAQIDEPIDSVWIYDGQNRLVMQLSEGEAVDAWTPLIPGDTVTVRFVNSAMRQTSKTWQPFPTTEAGWAAGALVCRKQVTATTWECAVDGPTIDFYSFNSEGYSIDQIAYLPAKE